MVHKKYIKRGDKVFGPYYYTSYRENGKVKTKYIKHGTRRKFISLGALIVIIAFIISLFLLRPILTGFAVKVWEGKHSQKLNLEINKNQEFDWELGEVHENTFMSSISVSGEILGEGNVKVYVDNEEERLLILDSEKIKREIATVTASVIQEMQSEGELEELVAESGSAELTGDAGPPESAIPAEPAEIVKESQKIKEEVKKRVIERLKERKEELSPSTVEETEQTEEPIEEVVETPTKVVKEKIEKEVVEEVFKKKFKFEDVCIETCSLPESFNKKSYKIIFEVNNALLKLHRINYYLKNISIVHISPVNVTQEKEIISGEGTITGTESTIQFGAVIGKPVKWKKVIKLNKETPAVITKIPKDAVKINVSKIVDGIKEEIKEVKIEGQKLEEYTQLTGMAIVEPEEVVTETPIRESTTEEASIVDIKEEEIAEEVIEIKIEKQLNETEEIEIEYETPGPQLAEEVIDEYRKRVVVSSEIHYRNILTYTEIAEVPAESIRLYWLVNGTRQRVHDINYIDSNENGLIDTIEWITPFLSNQTYEVDITVLNVQSYPTVGGNWQVRFTTIGTANLTIKAVNETTWSNENDDNDLKFLEIRCGDKILDYEWINDSVFIENYVCNKTGYETSRVLTSGKHTLEFTFGNVTVYAGNIAENLPRTLNVQGRLKNKTTGKIVSNGTYNFTFKIYTTATGGTALWEESQNLTVEKGVYSGILGSTTPINLPFDVPYYLGIDVNSKGEMSPRITMTNMPYSFRSFNISFSDIEGVPASATDIYVNETGDVMTGNLTVNANVSAVNIFATALYEAGQLLSSLYCKLTGCEIAGDLNVSGNVNVTGNVTAQYFIGNGSLLTGIEAGDDTNCSVDGSCPNIIYWTNESVLSVNSSVYLNGYGIAEFILWSNESLLNVNSSQYLNSYQAVDFRKITDEIVWINITSYPSACPAGQFVTQLGDTLTCSGETDPLWSGNSSLVLYVSNESTLNVNSSDYWNSYHVASDLNNAIILACQNITGAASDLCTVVDTTIGNCSITGSCPNIYYLANELGWANLTSYPSACPSGKFLVQINDTLTCETPDYITNCSISGSCSAIIYVGDANKTLSSYHNITDIPSCSGTEKLTFDGSTLSCMADDTISNCSTSNSCPNIIYTTNTSWVDASVTDVWVNASGDTMSGTLNMSGSNIIEIGNLTLAQKITFTLGEIIDNIVDGWIKITGALNVNDVFNVSSSGDVDVAGSITATEANTTNLNVSSQANIYNLTVEKNISAKNIYANGSLLTPSTNASLNYVYNGSDWKGMKASSDGTLQIDITHTNYGARAYLSAHQNIPSGAFTKVQLDTEDYDLGSDFDTTLSKFVAPVSGYYLVTATAGWYDSLAAGQTVLLGIYKNGVKVCGLQPAPDGVSPGNSISDVLYLVANDYLELYVYQGTGSDRRLYGTSTNTYMSIFLIAVA